MRFAELCEELEAYRAESELPEAGATVEQLIALFERIKSDLKASPASVVEAMVAGVLSG